jgi:hypothetical protein
MISYPLVLGTVAGLSFMLLSAGFALWKRKRYLPAILAGLAGAMLAGLLIAILSQGSVR